MEKEAFELGVPARRTAGERAAVTLLWHCGARQQRSASASPSLRSHSKNLVAYAQGGSQRFGFDSHPSFASAAFPAADVTMSDDLSVAFSGRELKGELQTNANFRLCLLDV